MPMRPELIPLVDLLSRIVYRQLQAQREAAGSAAPDDETDKESRDHDTAAEDILSR